MLPSHTLTIAGSDSGGGAGIQADLKTFTTLGCYGASVIAALTAQNTQGVQGIQTISPDFVEQQLDAVLSDLEFGSIKTGMLSNAGVIHTVAKTLKDHYPAGVPNFVIDPVMVATSGATLLEDSAIETLCSELIPLATIVTPNLPEGRILAGQTEKPEKEDIDYMKSLCRKISELGCQAVLLKGGHLEEKKINDVLYLVEKDEFRVWTHNKLDTKSTHGTGCTLSAAICSYLAQGHDIHSATSLAIEYIATAIQTAIPIGKGNGPVNHLHSTLQRSLPPITQQNATPLSDELIKQNQLDWDNYVEQNAFVRGLRDGTLPRKAFIHFLEQDYIFLKHYARVFSLAAYKSDSFAQIKAATETVNVIMHEAQVLHVAYCGQFGITQEQLDQVAEEPMTVAYTRYVLDVANTKSLLHLTVATSPCSLGYAEIAARIKANISQEELDRNPYKQWIEEYSSPIFTESVRKSQVQMETACRDEAISTATLKELSQIFNTATRMEAAFFGQSLNA